MLPSATIIDSHIHNGLDGWTGDTIFELDNGQIWQQETYAYAYHYANRPAVHPEREATLYRMTVEGMDGSILVRLLNVVADTTIDGDFDGWEGDTIFELSNGQVWQQAAYAYTYTMRTGPTC